MVLAGILSVKGEENAIPLWQQIPSQVPRKNKASVPANKYAERSRERQRWRILQHNLCCAVLPSSYSFGPFVVHREVGFQGPFPPKKQIPLGVFVEILSFGTLQKRDFERSRVSANCMGVRSLRLPRPGHHNFFFFFSGIRHTECAFVLEHRRISPSLFAVNRLSRPVSSDRARALQSGERAPGLFR